MAGDEISEEQARNDAGSTSDSGADGQAHGQGRSYAWVGRPHIPTIRAADPVRLSSNTHQRTGDPHGSIAKMRPLMAHTARRVRRDPASAGRPLTHRVDGHLAQHRTPGQPGRTESTGRGNPATVSDSDGQG